MTCKEAVETAQALRDGEEDGWHYEVAKRQTGYDVMVKDSDMVFVAYWSDSPVYKQFLAEGGVGVCTGEIPTSPEQWEVLLKL